MYRADDILERLAKREIARLKRIEAECADLLDNDYWLQLMKLRQDVMHKALGMKAKDAVAYMEAKQAEMDAIEKKVKKAKNTMRLIDKQIQAELDIDALEWWLSYQEFRKA